MLGRGRGKRETHGPAAAANGGKGIYVDGMRRLLSYCAVVCLSTALSDEFANPSHTPAIQILFPKRNSCTNRSFELAFAAPISAEVRISIDNQEVAVVSGETRFGEFAGLTDGIHQ